MIFPPSPLPPSLPSPPPSPPSPLPPFPPSPPPQFSLWEIEWFLTRSCTQQAIVIKQEIVLQIHFRGKSRCSNMTLIKSIHFQEDVGWAYYKNMLISTVAHSHDIDTVIVHIPQPLEYLTGKVFHYAMVVTQCTVHTLHYHTGISVFPDTCYCQL